MENMSSICASYPTHMNAIARFMKEQRKRTGLTQEKFALRSGLGLRFVRNLEQGESSLGHVWVSGGSRTPDR